MNLRALANETWIQTVVDNSMDTDKRVNLPVCKCKSWWENCFVHWFSHEFFQIREKLTPCGLTFTVKGNNSDEPKRSDQ